MEAEGPLLETLTRRLAECPEEFLQPPRSGARGMLHVEALMADHLRDLGVPRPDPLAAGASPAHLSLLAIAVWLLHDPWFLACPQLAPAMQALFPQLADLAEVVAPASFVTDPDRREELARRCLQHLGLRPEGESPAQAADRLAGLDSLERTRVVRDTRQAEARARQVREMMGRRAAEEAAAKATRE